jgi:hypothetical protein
MLLDCGARFDVANIDGNTALQLAAREGELECARLLVRAGASRTERNQDGKTALELARENGKIPVAVLLALDDVTKMGFPEAKAEEVLSACGGDAERAIDQLLAAQQAEEERQQRLVQQRAAEAAQRRAEEEQRRLEEERRRREEEERAGKVAQFRAQCFTDEETARGCLESSGWDVSRAVLSYIPASPVSGRTLSKSEFNVAYNKANAPKGAMQLGHAVGMLVQAYCAKEGIPYEEDEGEHFFEELQAEAEENPGELAEADQLPVAAQRMWTSALQLRDREFCFILNACVRHDWKEAAAPLAKVTRAINQLCVTAGVTGHAAVHPPDNVCFRGGGFDSQFRGFFVQGRKFRQPAYLATSFSEQVARGFIADRGGDDCTLWRVHIDPERKCAHVNLVKKTNVRGEEEYLFAPYSTFTVLSAVWRAGTAEGPHEIELLAAVDNKEEPEGLPLAPWS